MMLFQNNDEMTKVFTDEINDLLTEAETSLMKLNDEPENPDLIARVFRSLHTIKGSSGMFGYSGMSSFVHDLETTFDSIRHGELKISREITNLSLKALDCINDLLKLEENEEAKNKRESVLDELRRITDADSRAEKTGDSGSLPGDEKSPGIEGDQGSVHSGKIENYRITFKPSREILLRGIKLDSVFHELDSMGALSLAAGSMDLPDIDDINPFHCYTEWDATLLTDKGADAVRDVFVFVKDYAEIKISKTDSEEAHTGNEVHTPAVFERRKTDSTSIRVKNQKLDLLVNLVGELVTLNARLNQEAHISNIPEFISISESFNRLTSELRDNTMSIRMVPLTELFNSYNRLVFDLESKLKKKIKLQIRGGETELDKNMIEELRDPLMHLIRNCADHGIEPPAERIAAGKPETGTILLSAEYSGSSVLIKIADDGAGLNKEKIMKKAIEHEMIDPSVHDESVIFSKIMEPGFSTADSATDISGRGVGMDVVKRNIEKLRGSVSIKSQSGEGVTILLNIPLTLAIIDGFMFEIAGNLFIFNLSNVLECLDFNKSSEETASGRFTISLRGEMISCLDLKKVLGMDSDESILPQVVITDVGGERVGFLVDRLVGKYQTVIKPINKSVNIKDIIVGAAILGNGAIAFVLDINKIITFALENGENRLQNLNQTRQGEKK